MKGAERWTDGVYAVEGGVVDAAGRWDEPGAEGEWRPVCEGSDLTANIRRQQLAVTRRAAQCGSRR